MRISAREALSHPWFNPENKSVSENVLLEVSVNIANLREEMNVDMRQMKNEDVNMVTCTPLLGRRQMIVDASPLLPMGGNRDATPLMRVNYRPNGDSTQIAVGGGLVMNRPGGPTGM